MAPNNKVVDKANESKQSMNVIRGTEQSCSYQSDVNAINRIRTKGYNSDPEAASDKQTREQVKP